MANTTIDSKKLSQIEMVGRLLMALILLTAGISKFFSGGSFADYYVGQFASESLRINLPVFMVGAYLSLIPFIEVGLGLALLVERLKPITVYAWYAFMATLLVGHYVLQEWSSVNQMLAFFFLGMIVHALPSKSGL